MASAGVRREPGGEQSDAAAAGVAGSGAAAAASGGGSGTASQTFRFATAEGPDVRSLLDRTSAADFRALFDKYSEEQLSVSSLDWSQVKPPSVGERYQQFSDLCDCPNDDDLHQALLQKVAIVKLNGGLGRRMGCRGPKSAIEVRGRRTFIDAAVLQVEYLNSQYSVDVPLILMNSFQTHESTVKLVRNYASHNITIHCFTQSCYPYLDPDTMQPIPARPFSLESSDASTWYPPGHGDVFRSLHRSGLLQRLIDEGKEILFISNIDNTAATIDLKVLYHLDTERRSCPFCMEVTRRTRSDIHGGVLVERADQLSLVEAGQVPPEKMDEFRSLKRFQVFNTNNMWVRSREVQRLVESQALRPTTVLASRRRLDTRDRRNRDRYGLQLETTAGAHIAHFENAMGLLVPRSRFLPVKTTSDLLLVQSNLFRFRHGELRRSEVRESDALPVVKLGPEFARVSDYSKRFEKGLPDIVDLDHLTVSGNVVFGRGVKLRGTVIIVAADGSRIDVPDGAVFEDKIITGNLRILEH